MGLLFSLNGAMIVLFQYTQTLAANMASGEYRGRYLGVQGMACQMGSALKPVLFV